MPVCDRPAADAAWKLGSLLVTKQPIVVGVITDSVLAREVVAKGWIQYDRCQNLHANAGGSH